MSTMPVSQRIILSLRDRERLKRQIDECQSRLRGQIVMPRGAPGEGMNARREGRWNSFIDHAVTEDAGLISQQMRRAKRVLDRGSPVDLSRRERAAMERQAKEDAEFLRRQMVPKKVYNQPSVFHRGDRIEQNPAFAKAQSAVEKREVMNSEFQKRANRYKNSMRQLDPDNPEASNLERLRPTK